MNLSEKESETEEEINILTDEAQKSKNIIVNKSPSLEISTISMGYSKIIPHLFSNSNCIKNIFEFPFKIIFMLTIPFLENPLISTIFKFMVYFNVCFITMIFFFDFISSK